MPTTSVKRRIPHTSHGESRIKPGKVATVSKSKPRAVPAGRFVPPAYVDLTGEEYDAIPWEEIFALGVK